MLSVSCILDASIQVRQFEERDLERVLVIERDSFAREAWSQRLFLAYFRKHSELFLIAKLGRRTAGYIITCVDSRNAELASIAVNSRDRRRGVGQAMLDYTLTELRARKAKTWWLMVDTANAAGIRFYENYGFSRTKLVKRYYGPGRDAWRMRLTL